MTGNDGNGVRVVHVAEMRARPGVRDEELIAASQEAQDGFFAAHICSYRMLVARLKLLVWFNLRGRTAAWPTRATLRSANKFSFIVMCFGIGEM